MEYSEISRELDKLGFISQCHEMINALTVGIPKEDGEPKLDSFFRIEINDSKTNLIYFNTQLPIEKEFKTIEELLKFVRQVFPIEN
ncbi:hypothetical protein HHL23_13755 [Chryseobacterium sp. RP-3-3]|uniref:Uncharacterized protein n=1 Tax=Chryseobacterium antibioticum TaxID=2728847 RepID=A0A7Y0AP69_9FLAO|nr:hypothetical protein [Chryseobacterium antibioticum]NML70850.1 hypothetical protein [Chryseobacterium antibioticum]